MKMKKDIFFLFVFLLALVAQTSYAQSFVVKGQVKSQDDNEPLIGVAVMQEGTTNGVTTDLDGNYVIELKGANQAVLAFSYVGMKSQKHTVNAQTKVLNVVLKSDAEVMEEVVVVAYGVRKKGTIAGSVSTVKAEKMENVPAAGFDQALQGQTPGLIVLSNSGEPSKAATFQIRGTNSINSGTSPLFLLDGVPISSSDFNTISPSDIESISVLKDASSTSIYGARAANGVVVITTKRGTCVAKDGSAVSCGDVLISGRVTFGEDDGYQTHASGLCEADTVYEKEGIYKLYRNHKTFTGRKRNLLSLKLFGLTVPLYFNDETDYEYYDTEKKVYEISLKNENYLGVGLEKVSHIEYNVIKEPISEESCAEFARYELEKEISKGKAAFYLKDLKDSDGNIITLE